ncbi:MAG TPA: hypothetical protein EYP31_01825, partial [Roseibacterium sp.]|nr:hypothetical protein [Roseibacterium sp.]
RMLLLLLCLVAGPLGLWLAVVQPLYDARSAARTELAEALILQQWVDDRARENQALILAKQAGGPGGRSGGGAPPIGIAGLEQSLIEAGLRDSVSELTRRTDTGIDTGIELRFDTVVFVDLGRWIARASLSWGYEISGFRIERGSEDGLVAASFSLVPG